MIKSLGNVIRTRKGLILLVAVAVACQAVFPLLGNYSPYHPDSRCYLTMASAIAGGKPLSGFPNGYPLILAAFGTLTRQEPLPAGLAVALNCILSIALVLIAYKLVGFLTDNEKIRLVVAFLLAVSPIQLYFAHKVLTEVPIAFLMAAGSLLLLKKRHFPAGLLTALGIWIKPSLVLLPLATLIGIVAFHKKWSMALRFVAGIMVVYVLATVLNVAGITAPSNSTEANMLYSIGGKSSTLRIGLICGPQKIEFMLDEFSQAAQNNPLLAYFSFAVHHPLAYASQRLDAFVEMWSPLVASRDTLYPQSPLAKCFRLINTLFFCSSLALGVYVFTRKNREKWEAVYLLLVPVLSLTVVYVLSFGNRRFSFPCDAYVTALGVFFLSICWQHFLDARKKTSQ